MEPRRTLRQYLIDTELAHLRVMARLWGVDVQASQPLNVAAELADALVDPALASDVWETLPEDQRAALAALLDADGVMAVGAFARRFGEIRPMGPGRLEREKPWRNPASPAEGLWYRGLIYQGFAGQERESYPVFVVPTELQAALPVRAGTSKKVRLEAAPLPPYRRFAGGQFLDDVTTFLAFVHNAKVRLTGSLDAWPGQVQRALGSQLHDPDAERLAFMLHLVDHLGWLRQGDDRRLRLVADPVTAWLQAEIPRAVEMLVDAWLEMRDWNELWRLPTLQFEDTGKWRNDPTLARAALLQHLDTLTPGEWVSLEDFVQAIKDVDPDFQRPGGDYDSWYIRDAASGVFLTGFESWDQVEGSLLQSLLTGPAWWLGLVELGAQESKGAFDRFCPRPAAPSPPDAPLPVVHPDLTVTLPPLYRFERFQLARVADFVSLGEGYVYRFTPTSLERAREQKITVERTLDFVGGLSDSPLPKSVQLSLTRWASRGTEAWLERATFIRVANEAVLQQVIDSPLTGRYVGRVVGPTTAIVADEDWPALVEALAELGLLVDLQSFRA